MTGYLYLLAAVSFVGWSACLYWLGRIDGSRSERRRAAHVREMVRRNLGE